MAITTTCSGCGKTLAVADEFAGRQARCPACGQVYTVPSASTSGETPQGAALGGEYSAPGTSGPLNLGTPSQPPPSGEPTVHYWMKTTNGHEYGPVDRATLDRWFAEGRVGPGYEIRAGQHGTWQPAHLHKPSVALGTPASTNPFAAYPSGAMNLPLGKQYPKPDQSGLVLAMGILSWLVCPICGVIAWVMGGQTLKDMQLGLADPTNRGLVQVGYYLGMVHVILAICCIGIYVFILAMVAIAGNF